MRLCFILLLPLLFFSISSPSFALKRAYVVYMGVHSHGNDEVSEIDLLQVRESHFDLLGSFIGSRDIAKESIFYSYTRHINGFAAMLKDGEASAIAKHPKVVSVFLNSGRKLHTTRSWSFLGLPDNGVSIWEKARFGEDTIIANLDTGVWPESESFSDMGFGPIPARWKGICQNDTVPLGVRCNRKLIGARYFNKAYLVGLSNATDVPVAPVHSARDVVGHGSHTLSTAAGNFVGNVSVFGYGNGTAKGGSPRARVAAYKVCWTPIQGNECFDADILAAFDAAISDGVDVISASLGGSPSLLLNDSLSIGSFHATMKGISVICSAGNSGPDNSTVSNVSPWQFTIGASTIDRDFSSWVILGNNKRFKGESLAPKSLPPGKLYPIMSAADAKAPNANASDALLCKPGSLDSNKAKGKILVCLRGQNARVDKGEQALLAGAVGMVLANDQNSGNEVIADPHVLPASHITYSDGNIVFSYVNSTKSPMAYITLTVTKLDTKPAPVMAAFSSRGPNAITPEILKPDVTAPGVSIIAAYTEAQGPTNQVFDKRRVKYNAVSGTSMSCPHVSGVVGLLKTLYPHWSPAAIKSAIMTTAVTMDNVMEPILNSSNLEADPFSYGAGHIQPNRAMDPGLVYDLRIKDYLNFLCSIGYNDTSITLFSVKPYHCPANFTITNLNYPSISVPNLNNSITVYRTVTNVGPPATYKANIQNPFGIKAIVNPRTLKFKRTGQKKTFCLTLKKSKAASKDYVFGQLTWSDGLHNVRSPIVVKAV
ncbi:hypothetical protein V2J09_020763 [Rumex salicifolius]